MILLDTNVVTELLKPQAEAAVLAFLRRQFLSSLFMPSIVAAEVRYGIEALPDGRRQQALRQNFEALLRSGFSSRIIGFDAGCAEGYAAARARRKAMGRPVEAMDALIGGTALAHGATLATRNTRDFDGYGLQLVNPWEAL